MSSDELQHWGILNMKWHIRRFQNPDGSLTPEGRERYRKTKAKDIADKRNAKQKDKRNDKSQNNIDNPNSNNKEHNKSESNHSKSDKSNSGLENVKKTVTSLFKGSNKNKNDSVKRNKKPEEMSDDELYKLSKRYKALSGYYDAQNNYLKNQAYNKDLTAPKKAPVIKFVENTLGRAFENYLTTSTEFGFYMLGASFLDAAGSKYADDYVNWVFHRGKKDNKKDKDDDKNNGGNGWNNGSNGNNGNNGHNKNNKKHP